MSVRGYLVTDPDCGFCQKSAAWLKKYFSSHWTNTPASTEVLQRFDISASEAATSVWFVVERDGAAPRKYAGSTAIAQLIAMKGGFWRVALVGTVPPLSWLFQSIYKAIARNRHRLPASTCTYTPATSEPPRTG